MDIIPAVLTLGGLGVVFGGLLAYVAKRFAVEEDPRVAEISEILPGANCGACGYAGCTAFAEAVVKGKAEANECIPGGAAVTEEICRIIGKEVSCKSPTIARVFCIGDREKTRNRFRYDGYPDCKAAQTFYGGFTGCAYSCLGLGTCVRACPFEAIVIGENRLPIIDEGKCTGCGLCVEACPRSVIQLVDSLCKGHMVLCSSHDRGRIVREACDVGCIACKACEKVCPEKAIKVKDKLAVIDPQLCTDCGACREKCPRPVIINQSLSLANKHKTVTAASLYSPSSSKADKS